MARKRLGEILIEAKAIDEVKLRAALSEQRKYGGPLGRILVADRPEGDHRARVVERPGTQLDATVVRGVEPGVRLGLPHHGFAMQSMLADRAAALSAH